MGISYELSSQELKALSVPHSLRFLLCVESDIILCASHVNKKQSLTIRFPIFENTFQKLLGLCAERFGLVCSHDNGHSLLSGVAVIPSLRYNDYLPGGLYVEEVLSCLGVKQVTTPKRCGDSGHNFIASFTDYSEFLTEFLSADVHGAGFCLTIDYGLSTANHSHLVEIRFNKDFTVEEALKEYEEFSGWSNFDLRFDDIEHKQAGGVLVMPSIQDACDLFEKYEDEDSDDEGELLPFILRPVAPLTFVPSVEDSSLKKLRDQHWGEVEKFWERFSKWRNCVVVTNLYESASLEDTLSFFEGLTVTSSAMVEDYSPAARRRVFVTFLTSDDARKALLLDGRSTKGKTLRVQVSPPYMNESRRGRVVGSHENLVSNHPSTQNKCSGNACNVFDVLSTASKDKGGKRNCDSAKKNATALSNNTAAHAASAAGSASAAVVVSSGDVAAEIDAGAGSQKLTPASFPQLIHCASLAGSTMNVGAKEFYPSASFQVNSSSSNFYPSPLSAPVSFVDDCHALAPTYPQLAAVPSVGAVTQAGATHRSPKVGSAPPPYTAPPPYSVAMGHTMHIVSHQQQPPSSSM